MCDVCEGGGEWFIKTVHNVLLLHIVPAAGYTVKTAFITNKSEICLFAVSILTHFTLYLYINRFSLYPSPPSLPLLQSLSQSEESENKPVSKNSSNMLWTYNLKSCSW